MKTNLNLLVAWLWILLGFVSGMLLGLFFHHEKWLGGYASFKRRLYRFAHISFFGLGAVNLLLCLTTVLAGCLWFNSRLTSSCGENLAGLVC
jgi:hypothetical protein